MSESIAVDPFAEEVDVAEVSTPTTPPKEGTTPPAKPKPTETDELKSAMAELARNVAAGQKKEEPKETELTEDQKAELWGVYDPKKSKADFFHKFFKMNPDTTPEEVAEVEGLFADMQKGFVRQSVISSRNLFQAELAKFREEFEPLKNHYSQAQAREIKARFTEAYPSLADDKFAKIINAVAPSLEGKQFKDEKEYFQALAEGAAEVIRGAIPDFDPSAAKPTKATKPAGTTPRLPRSSVGGTGGVGGGGSAKVEKVGNTDEIFD